MNKQEHDRINEEFVNKVQEYLDAFNEGFSEDDEWDDEPEDPGYSNLSDTELMEKFFSLKQDLLNRGVLLEPKTSEDMSLQSTYLGLLAEMRKRNLS